MFENQTYCSGDCLGCLLLQVCCGNWAPLKSPNFCMRLGWNWPYSLHFCAWNNRWGCITIVSLGNKERFQYFKQVTEEYFFSQSNQVNEELHQIIEACVLLKHALFNLLRFPPRYKGKVSLPKFCNWVNILGGFCVLLLSYKASELLLLSFCWCWKEGRSKLEAPACQ